MSLVLAFDCAVSGLGIAVVRDGAHLAGRAEGGRDQAARLLPAIETALGAAGVGRRDLSLIAVTIGPGSFTGVRVGLAAARGLAVGLGVPLAGLATTSVLLAQATPRGRAVVAAIDSRLGDWFCAIAEGEEEPVPFVAAAPELALRLAGLAEGGRDQAARLLPAIETVLGEAGVGRRELSLIAVTIGPGSFTGVRVGLAAARGLAVGLGVPLAGLATTSVLLAQATPRGRAVVAAIDSRLGDWFCAIAEGEGEPVPFVAAAPELATRLGRRACLVIGSGAQTLVPQLVAAGIDAVAEEALPAPVTIARLAADAGAEAWRMRNKREGLPRPLYLRGVSITLPDGARRTVD